MMMKKIVGILLALALIPMTVFAVPVVVTWEWTHDDPMVTTFRYQIDGENPDKWIVVDASQTSYTTGELDGSKSYTLYLQQSYDGVHFSASAKAVANLLGVAPEVYSLVADKKPIDQAMSDGRRTFTYEDGSILSLTSTGEAEFDFAYGVKAAFTEKGWETTWNGLMVTKSALVGNNLVKGGRQLDYEDGMKALLNDDGTASVSLSSGVTVAWTGKRWETSWIGTTVTTSTLVGYNLVDGGRQLEYADGMKALLNDDGTATVSLANGVKVAWTGKRWETSWIGTTVTTSTLVGYNLVDGGRKLEYADGMKALLNDDGTATVTLSSGVTVAWTGKGWETSWNGIMVTRATPVGYVLVDGGREIDYEDGMKALLKDDGAATVSFSNGAKIAWDGKGFTSTYQGNHISDADLINYALDGEGTKNFGFSDGMKVWIASDGRLWASLPNGLSFGKDGATAYSGKLTGSKVVDVNVQGDGSYEIVYADGTRISFDKNGIIMASEKVADEPKDEKVEAQEVEEQKPEEQKAEEQKTEEQKTKEPKTEEQKPQIVESLNKFKMLVGSYVGSDITIMEKTMSPRDFNLALGIEAAANNILPFGKSSGLGLTARIAWEPYKNVSLMNRLSFSGTLDYNLALKDNSGMKVGMKVGFGGFGIHTFGSDTAYKNPTYWGLLADFGLAFDLPKNMYLSTDVVYRYYLTPGPKGAGTLGMNFGVGFRF